MSVTRRVEWRGDLFASDLETFLRRLAGARAVVHELPHTVTIFLDQPGGAIDVQRTLRIRAYCHLPDLRAASVHRTVAEGIAGKLQLKAHGGDTTEVSRGHVVLLHASAERESTGWWQLQCGDRRVEPSSVRVARRVHYELPARGGAGPVRVTVDLERTLFRVVDGALKLLGEMGPRVEIKAADPDDVERMVQQLNFDGMLRRLPYRSLELLFQDLLREAMPQTGPPGEAAAEVETKFEMAPADVMAAASAAIGWIDRRADLRLMLPFAHQIVRMRRYHFCRSADAGAECTIVETAAGRLSPKVKRDAASDGAVLVRRTAASRSTDLDGARQPVERFAEQHGWRPFTTMTKVQSKIPFAHASGNAYLVSVDDCADIRQTPLRQMEIEYAGSLGGPRPIGEVSAEMVSLAASLRAALPTLGLRPTDESKFRFYERSMRSSNTA